MNDSRFSLIDFPERNRGDIKLQGFSGLAFVQKIGDEAIFWTHSDRGPNAESYKRDGVEYRPFVWPDFQPTLTKFKVDLRHGQISYLEEVKLKLPDGRPLSGLPNLAPSRERRGEVPVRLDGSTLPYDLMGIDPEGICVQGGHFWLVEEYGPSLLKFRPDGTLVKRFVPQGFAPSYPSFVQELFPSEFLRRKENRGFEGLTCSATKLYAVLQSPLPGEGTNIRIVEIDPASETVSRTMNYPLESRQTDKIGDIAIHGNELYLIEQNDKEHFVFSIPLQENLPVRKRLVVDLVKAGFDFAEKVEGLAVLPTGEIMVVNDNDFGLSGEITPDGTPVIDPSKKTVLGVLR